MENCCKWYCSEVPFTHDVICMQGEFPGAISSITAVGAINFLILFKAHPTEGTHFKYHKQGQKPVGKEMVGEATDIVVIYE